MPVAPDPDEIYSRAEVEGRRRLSMGLHDQVATGFVAGVTIIFGLLALAIVEAELEPVLGPAAALGGALAFGIGVVFLIVGRSELFSENLFDPVAAAIQEGGASPWWRLARLWVVTLALNLLGGAVLVGLLTVDGALPGQSADVLVHTAEVIAGKGWEVTLVRAVLAGALITLLSYMLNAVDTVVARILLAYLVGFFLALGPFDHVVVSVLHLLFGIWLSDGVGWAALGTNLVLAAVGNVAGGLLLITFTHTAQVKG